MVPVYVNISDMLYENIMVYEVTYSDQLGSGVRNLYKYTKYYSGKEPEFKEGDIFRITVPLNEAYSFDFGTDATNATKSIVDFKECDAEKRILLLIEQNPSITQKQLNEYLGIPLGTIKRILPRLQEKGILKRIGNRRSGEWKIQKWM